MKDLLIHTTHTIKTSLKTETHRFIFRVTQEQTPCFMVWCLHHRYNVERITYAN